MPDPTLKTISASEVAALFNVSPWVTRWMLWHRFANGLNIDPPEDGRMKWGTLMEPIILAQAAIDLGLEVRVNRGEDGKQRYFRRGLLGCHRDGDVVFPDRGPAAIEVKCIFDYTTWMRDWNGGKAPPRHVEIQLQSQMMVGDGTRAYESGIIVAWVAGEVHYFERSPISELWNRIDQEAAGFFEQVGAAQEPEPFGVPVELPWLTQLFPLDRGKTIDLTAHADAESYVQAAVAYQAAKDQESAGKRTAEPLRAKVLAFVKDADRVELPNGVQVRVSMAGVKGKRIRVFVPETAGNIVAPSTIPEDHLYAG